MPATARTLPSSGHHYIRFAVLPPTADALALRKSIQDALGQAFGLASSHTYVDVLWNANDGKEAVVRIASNDAPRLLAATTTFTGSPRLSLVKESPFLPSLLPTADPFQ